MGLGMGVACLSNSGKISGRRLGCGVTHSCHRQYVPVAWRRRAQYCFSPITQRVMQCHLLPAAERIQKPRARRGGSAINPDHP